MADKSEIEEIRARCDIVELVSAYVTLKRAGHIYKGLCPFHQEKTPSFTVNPERGVWYCFGQCSEGGDVFKFLQKAENLSFAEALERLAIRTGVTLTPFSQASGSAPGPEASSQKDRLFLAVETAALYYQEMLSRSASAKEYLFQRGIGPETQRDFRLGFSEDSWDGLNNFLGQRGIEPQDAITAGVLVPTDRGGLRDKFRGRIIFPIMDAQERVVAFGGRLTQSIEGRPKYLNSAENPLYNKGRLLYALWRARKAIAAKQQAIVVEGYLDAISLHQAGYLNVVATLGTALTDEHAQMLRRLARTVLLSFDADRAGLKAAERATQTFAGFEMEVRMLDLPQGEDPDSLMREGRQSQFDRAVTSALPVAEYQLKRLVGLATKDDVTEQEKSDIFRQSILPIIRATGSVIDRDRYIRLCAAAHPAIRYGTPQAEAQIRQEIDSLPSSQSHAPEHSANRSWGRPAWNVRSTRPVFLDPPRRNAQTSAEETLLSALLGQDSEMAIASRSLIDPEQFSTPAYAEAARRVLAGESFDLADVSDAVLRLLARAEEEGDPITKAALEGAAAQLKRHRLENREKTLRQRIIEGDQAAVAEYQDVVRQRHGAIPKD